MEKYGQFRDKGSGIAPFFPASQQNAGITTLPFSLFLIFLRVPVSIFAWLVWLLLVQWVPPGTILRKANLWCLIGIPGMWWVDLQVDGVKRGSLGKSGWKYMPNGGSVIASSLTSPIDILYLATIFDPIFTQSYAGTRLVRHVSLLTALYNCFVIPKRPNGEEEASLVTLARLTAENPTRIIAVFPEGTTSNGRGILHLTHSLLSASPSTKIFPVSIKYSPQDIVTPIPGFNEAVQFLWRLYSQSTHTIRTRIGSSIVNALPKSSAQSHSMSKSTSRNRYEGNFFDTLDDQMALAAKEDDDITEHEQEVLDAVADTLARLGRVKRVDLGITEKTPFVQAWIKNKKYRK